MQVLLETKEVGVSDVGSVEEREKIEQRKPRHDMKIARGGKEQVRDGYISRLDEATYTFRMSALSFISPPNSRLSTLSEAFSTC